MENLIELAKPTWLVETEGGLALGACSSLIGRRGIKDLSPGSSRERHESVGVPVC